MKQQEIFNFYQGDVFIKYGAKVVGCGIDKGKAYLIFEANELFYDLLEKWNNRTLLKK